MLLDWKLCLWLPWFLGLQSWTGLTTVTGSLACKWHLMGLLSLIFTLTNSHFIHINKHVYLYVCGQSYPTLCGPRDCSLPGSSVHGIFQARMLEWVATSYSRRSAQPRHWACSLVLPALAAEFLPLVPPGKHIYIYSHIYLYLSVSYIFAFSYCSWGSQGKNTEVVCHFLLEWTTFCQNYPPWPICLGWSYTAWLIVPMS